MLHQYFKESYLKHLEMTYSPYYPDYFAQSKLFDYLYAFNGFRPGKYRWATIPMHNVLSGLNLNLATIYRWKKGQQHRTFYIDDMITRFFALSYFGFMFH